MKLDNQTKNQLEKVVNYVMLFGDLLDDNSSYSRHQFDLPDSCIEITHLKDTRLNHVVYIIDKAPNLQNSKINQEIKNIGCDEAYVQYLGTLDDITELSILGIYHDIPGVRSQLLVKSDHFKRFENVNQRDYKRFKELVM